MRDKRQAVDTVGGRIRVSIVGGYNMKHEVEFTVATDTDDESLLDMMARVGVILAQFSVDKHVPLMFTTHIYDITPDDAEYPLVCNNPAEELIVLVG